jgi:thioredoxin 1
MDAVKKAGPVEDLTQQPASNLNFESHIQGGKPVVVEFYAEWSAPCKLMIPVLHEVRETVGERATVLRINIEKDKAYAEDYAVQTVPTLIIFKKGIAVWRKNGIAPSHEILEHLNLLMD